MTPWQLRCRPKVLPWISAHNFTALYLFGEPLTSRLVEMDHRIDLLFHREWRQSWRFDWDDPLVFVAGDDARRTKCTG